jgi:uncharacterized membrane protein YeaQ/YmgE (transglycosylase-associated protein family)
MGFKRGWAEYNRVHKKKRKNHNPKVVHHMARRRKYYGKKKRYSKRSGFGMGSVTKIVIGVVGAVLYDVFISPMIPIPTNIKTYAEFVIGIMLMVWRGSPSWLKSAGMALAIVNGYAIVHGLMGGVGTSSGSNWD